MEQAQAPITVSTGVSSWQYLLLSIAPFLIGMAAAITITTYLKRINRSMGHVPYRMQAQYRMGCGLGFICGAFSHWGLDEMGQFLLGLPPMTVKAVFVTAVFTAIFTPMTYDFIRRRTKASEKWQWLYKALTVKHCAGVDYTDPDNEITQTRFSKPPPGEDKK